MRHTLALTAALALLAVAACDRKELVRPPAKGDVSGAAVPADAAAPLAYESKTPYAEVSLTLPAAIKSQPDLHQRLYNEGVRDLARFNEGAQADRTEFGGDEALPPYGRTLEWTAEGETPRLVSLSQSGSEFTGGAHPNPFFGAMIWDKRTNQPVAPAALFRPGADMTVLDRALCQAANAEKRKRDPQAQPASLAAGADWSCPKAVATPFVLTPGAGGKITGLTFLIGPYQIGSYAEGAYEVDVPTAAFKPLLAPEYAAEF